MSNADGECARGWCTLRRRGCQLEGCKWSDVYCKAKGVWFVSGREAELFEPRVKSISSRMGRARVDLTLDLTLMGVAVFIGVASSMERSASFFSVQKHARNRCYAGM